MFFYLWYVSVTLERLPICYYFTLIFYPALSSNFASKIFSNCEFVYVFSHLKPPKCFSCISSHFEVASDQLHASLHFISILFARFITKGILVISSVKTLFNLLKLSLSLFNLLYKPLFQFHVKIHVKNCIWIILSQFIP
jgi:hypothetical protein